MTCRAEILAIIAKLEQLAQMAATLDSPLVDLLLSKARDELRNLLALASG